MSQDKIAHTPEGVLVRLKDKLWAALELDPYKIKMLIDRFVTTSFEGVTSSKSHFAKVNIYNELTKPKMTIKVFFKFLNIISIKKIRISITVTTLRDRDVTVCEDVFLLGQQGLDDDETDKK